MVYALHLFVKGGGVRSACDDGNARAVAALDDLLERRALDNHARCECEIGPVQVSILERCHIEIDQAQVVPGREHRGDSEQAERRKGSPDTQEIQREVVAQYVGGCFG